MVNIYYHNHNLIQRAGSRQVARSGSTDQSWLFASPWSDVLRMTTRRDPTLWIKLLWYTRPFNYKENISKLFEVNLHCLPFKPFGRGDSFKTLTR